MKSSSWRRFARFKQAQLLHIAAADIAGTLPVMKVSDHLTWLAEAMINAVVQQARCGNGGPLWAADAPSTSARGAVLRWSATASWEAELGYSSDLDPYSSTIVRWEA